jgi:hypothetical protein
VEVEELLQWMKKIRWLLILKLVVYGIIY